MTTAFSGIAGRFGFPVMTLLFALWVMPSRNYPINADADASPEKLALGVAATPYQYRVLVPFLVRQLTPQAATEPAAFKPGYWAVEFLALVALGFAVRRYLALFIRGQAMTSVLALSTYALLPFNYRLQDFYPYDVPSMLFFTVGLILIDQRRWLLFYPLFVVATINRETSIFLTVATALIWFGRQPVHQTAVHVLGQGVLWLLTKWWLFETFKGNPAFGYGLFQPQLKMNVVLLLEHPLSIAAALSTWAFLWIPVIARYDRIRHPGLRRTLWLVPMVVAAMTLVGVVTETRIYAELLPVVMAGAFVVLIDSLKSYFTTTHEPLIT